MTQQNPISTEPHSDLQIATLAGGCFWCMVPPFENLEGVKEVVSGYTGGHLQNPTYEEVTTGQTGHVEAIQILFDPKLISYTDVLNVFWENIDPTDENGQFVDQGSQYITAIFCHSEEQKIQALRSKKSLEESGRFQKPIATKVVPAQEFFSAEGYHQSYYRKSPNQYKQYRSGSGRDQFLKKHWDK